MSGDGVDLVWHGWPELDHAFNQLEARLERATEAATKAAAEEVQRATRAEFTGSGGRPARRSGTLAGSVIVDGPHKVGFGGEYMAQIGPSEVVYARVVELGKKGRRHRKPHPYLTPGYQAASRKFAEIFRAHWSKP